MSFWDRNGALILFALLFALLRTIRPMVAGWLDSGKINNPSPGWWGGVVRFINRQAGRDSDSDSDSDSGGEEPEREAVDDLAELPADEDPQDVETYYSARGDASRLEEYLFRCLTQTGLNTATIVREAKNACGESESTVYRVLRKVRPDAQWFMEQRTRKDADNGQG